MLKSRDDGADVEIVLALQSESEEEQLNMVASLGGSR